MSVKSSISLTDQQDAFARSLVESGRYSSMSSVLQQGLDCFAKRRKLRPSKRQRLANWSSGD